MAARGAHQHHVRAQSPVELQRSGQFGRIALGHQHGYPAVMLTRERITDKQVGQAVRGSVKIAAAAGRVTGRRQQVKITKMRFLLREGIVRFDKAADLPQ